MHSTRLDAEGKLMTNGFKARYDLTELGVRALEGEGTAADMEQLRQRLETDPAARQYYIELVSLCADLHYCYVPNAMSPPRFPGDASCDSASKSSRFWQSSRQGGVLLRQPTERGADARRAVYRMSGWRIAAVLAFVAIAVMGLTSPLWWPPQARVPLATLTDTVDAKWGGLHAALIEGDDLSRTDLVLDRGYASIALANGVKLVVAGPARFRVDALNLVHLDLGRLTVDVPHSASGFVVQTSTARVTDVGTTFGVRAFANGDGEVQVLRGKVRAALLTADGTVGAVTELTQNDAAAFHRITGTLASIPATPASYVTNIHRILMPIALHGTGQRLKPGAADPYWRIIANTDDPKWVAKPAIVVRPLGGVWGGPLGSDNSQWISTARNPPAMGDHCRLTFATTLDLTGVEAGSVRLHLSMLADDDVDAVRINGYVTPIMFTGNKRDFVHFHQFDLSDGLIAGTNTLEVVLANRAPAIPGTDNSRNVMGLRVELSGTAIRKAH
jgi:hypothetical protein